MLFNSVAYLIFLPIVVLLFWRVPFKWRTAFLLFASYVFYMTWKPVYGLLMLGLTAINYFIGLSMAKSQTRRKAWLIGGIMLNLILLGFFKYTYMMHDMVNSVVKMTGYELLPVPFEIILPLGISFFVFEFIHYLVEVYKGGAVVKGPLDFALFAAFFPTQIAGPIKRYQDFMPQLREPQKVGLTEFNEGIELIVFGLFKKVVIADTIAIAVSRCYAHPEMLSGIDLWLAIWGFACQVYCDFSGYTDIARGSAKLLGFKVPLNFDLPFMAASISEFWRRWHMSLSSWLRDYLYFPLGGSKKGEFNTCRNILLTMTLAGLWHGAAPHFVVWGFVLGASIVLHRMWRALVGLNPWLNPLLQTRVFQLFAVWLTFQTFCTTLVVFRAQDCQMAWMILRRMFFLEPAPNGLNFWDPTVMNSSGSFIYPLLPFVLVGFWISQVIGLKNKGTPGVLAIPEALRAFRPIYLAILIAVLLVLSPDMTPQFIYFQF